MNTSISPGTRVRNARGSGARLRDEILAAAMRLLGEGTAESVTLRAIAREAGITAPSIYRHFDSIQAIFRAVVEMTFVELEEVLRRAAVGDDAAARLRGVTRAYLDFAREHPEEYRLLFGGAWNAADVPADAAERSELEALGLGALQVLIDSLRACIEEGSSRSADAATDAVALWVGLHGLAGLRRTTPLFPWPAAIEDDLVRSLARLG